METLVTYRHLDMRSRFVSEEQEAFQDLLRQLFRGANEVYQYFHADHPDLKQSFLVQLSLDSPSELSRASVFLDPSHCLEKEWTESIARNQPCRVLDYPGRSMIWRYANPRAILLFSDGFGDWVGVLEMPKDGHFDIIWSWGDPSRQVSKLKKLLEELLEGEPPQRITYSKKLKDKESAPANPSHIEEDPLQKENAGTWVIPQMKWPEDLELRDYQEQAIQAWRQNGGKGILAMATGSGKTLTALSLACRVAAKNQPIVLVVVCPFVNLCNQWIEEIRAFGLKAIACYQGRSQWEQKIRETYQAVSAGLNPVMAIVTTTSTFRSPAFQSIFKAKISIFHHFVIADEVHNLGAEKIQKVLPEEVHLRLGLSATPERHHDPEGTASLMNYFGGVVYEYPIDRAIADGGLCPYLYFPHVVQLTDEEAEEYAEITEKLGKILCRQEDDAELGQSAMSLLIRRARLLAGAQNKIPALNRVLKALPAKPEKALFYCGDGRTTDQVSQEERRQIEAVARLLGDQHGLRVRNFTYREKTEEREQILKDLGSGFLDGVVAIRCLDEGIDLPDLRMGFLLASSTNPRQFIQRRGRLLRKAEGKEFAIIHDFIIEPPDFGGSLSDDAYNLERRFFKRELMRIQDFCNTADNGQTALNFLKDLRLKYGLIA